MESGLPRFALPPFSATLGNETVGFFGMVERLGPGLGVLPFVMVLANIAIAKAFSEYLRLTRYKPENLCNCFHYFNGNTYVENILYLTLMLRMLSWSHLPVTYACVVCGRAGEGGVVDATQEMLTLGICNVVGACVRAMPTCGAFTRSAVSHSSGVRTPAAGLYSGTFYSDSRISWTFSSSPWIM